jgi:LysM repeat protein
MSRSHQPTVRLRRSVRGGVLHQLHAKMNRLPAHLTSEDDWKHDQPGVRLSRVFGVVLGIHIVAIGGLMAYEMFRHREPQATSALRSAPRELRPASGSPAAAGRVTDAFADDPVHDGLRKHIVAPGEGMAGIAALYGVDEKALLVKNRLGDGRPFKSGMKLVIPNNQLQAAAPADPARLLAAPVTPRNALEPVATPAYDPSLEVRRAEFVAEAGPDTAEEPAPKAVAAPTARPAAPAPAPARPAPVMVATTKKPSPPPAKKTEVAATVKSKPKAKGRVHVVKDGENFYRIAKAYGVNVDQLIKTNGINPGTLRPGTALTIPSAR